MRILRVSLRTDTWYEIIYTSVNLLYANNVCHTYIYVVEMLNGFKSENETIGGESLSGFSFQQMSDYMSE